MQRTRRRFASRFRITVDVSRCCKHSELRNRRQIAFIFSADRSYLFSFFSRTGGIPRGKSSASRDERQVIIRLVRIGRRRMSLGNFRVRTIGNDGSFLKFSIHSCASAQRKSTYPPLIARPRGKCLDARNDRLVTKQSIEFISRLLFRGARGTLYLAAAEK